jgi:hypothetical protein
MPTRMPATTDSSGDDDSGSAGAHSLVAGLAGTLPSAPGLVEVLGVVDGWVEGAAEVDVVDGAEDVDGDTDADGAEDDEAPDEEDGLGVDDVEARRLGEAECFGEGEDEDEAVGEGVAVCVGTTTAGVPATSSGWTNR